MNFSKFIGAGLGMIFTAAATGFLIAKGAGQDKDVSKDPATAPRSAEGRLLENWLEYCKYFFNRDKSYETSNDSRSNLLSEIKEFSVWRLTDGDKFWVSERLKELHDICQRRNVYLKVSGLETYKNANTKVTIEVDPARPYDENEHPNPSVNDGHGGGPVGLAPN